MVNPVKNYYFDIDFSERGSCLDIIGITSEAYSVHLNLTLKFQGVVMDLSNTVIIMYFRLPNGNYVELNGSNGISIEYAEGGIIKAILKNTIFVSNGNVYFEVEVDDSITGQRIMISSGYYFTVSQSVYNQEMTEEEENLLRTELHTHTSNLTIHEAFPSKIGNAGKVLEVNVDEDGLEWVECGSGNVGDMKKGVYDLNDYGIV